MLKLTILYIRYDHISEDHITDIYCIAQKWVFSASRCVYPLQGYAWRQMQWRHRWKKVEEEGNPAFEGLPTDIYCDILETFNEKCAEHSPLEMWKYDEDVIAHLTQQVRGQFKSVKRGEETMRKQQGSKKAINVSHNERSIKLLRFLAHSIWHGSVPRV